ncbi:DNA/RNA non-specific endonuclease [Curtobacterium sp. RRHDQ66]|uniref:DNA/RNA non-specific endonuclease n=1 Tax=Curtobacterium guangdongense TaxID=3413380 RepID=UPI003BF31126
MTMVRLNAFGLAADGDDVSGVAHDISTAWSTLHSALHGTAGMAGDDESAEEFAHVYDSQAKSAATSAKNLVGMLAAFETLLAGTGSAYKDAEIASAGQQGGSGIAIPSSDFAVATDLPSSLGAGWPGGWGKVEDVLQDALRAIGVQLPQGDPDKLSSAAESWNSYESSLRTASNRLSGGLAQVNAADIPQKATILAAKQTMSGHIGTAADAATGAAASLKQIKANYDQAAEEIRSMIEQLLAELALDVGISIALSFVTFGLGALAGAANGARLVVTWANRIAGVIRKLALLNKIHAEQFLKAANMLRKLEHGSFVTRFTYETVKGTITGTAAPIIVNALHGKGTSMNDIIATAAGSVVGGAFGGFGGAALSRVGRGAASEAAGTVAPTFWKATAVEGAKSAATGAVGGAAGGVTQDGLAAVMDPENHHFNVLQSLAGGTVLGTVGGATIGAGSHAVSTGWHHVTGGGHSSGDGTTVDVDVTPVDASTNVDTTSSSAPDAPAADTGSHAPSIQQSAPVAGGNTAGAPGHAGGGDRPHIDGSQTPVVNESAQASTSAHGAGERPHIDGSQTPVVNEAAHAGSTADGTGSHVAVDHVEAPAHVDAPAHDGSSAHADGPTAPHEAASSHGEPGGHDAQPAHESASREALSGHESNGAHDGTTGHTTATAGEHSGAAGQNTANADVPMSDAHAATTHVDPSQTHASAESPAVVEHAGQAAHPDGDPASAGTREHLDAETIRSGVADSSAPSHADIASAESHIVHDLSGTAPHEGTTSHEVAAPHEAVDASASHDAPTGHVEGAATAATAGIAAHAAAPAHTPHSPSPSSSSELPRRPGARRPTATTPERGGDRPHGGDAARERAAQAREALRQTRAAESPDARDPFRGHPSGHNPSIDATSVPDQHGIERNASGEQVVRVESKVITGQSARALRAAYIEPNTVYVVDGGRWLFHTDGLGRTQHWEAHIDEVVQQTPNNRSASQQRRAGFEDRLPFDEGGHHIAAMFGAPPEAINLSAMHERVNGVTYARMETEMRDHVLHIDAQGGATTIDAHGRVRYVDESKRPSQYLVRLRFLGDGWRPWQRFNNPVEAAE